ncbi:MAG: sugar nucleotide-binding protein, partial [Deinococcus sp.]|nr:sugar nucleotide-binding protein [Deinococcus sp.]
GPGADPRRASPNEAGPPWRPVATGRRSGGLVMRVVLIGASGQLGSDLAQVLSSRPGVSLFPLTHAQLDITQVEQVRTVLTEKRPEVVINTAAYHRVDDCETNIGQAFAVNAVAVAQLAAITIS